jgi:hypothetical protein
MQEGKMNFNLIPFTHLYLIGQEKAENEISIYKEKDTESLCSPIGKKKRKFKQISKKGKKS